MKGIDVSHWGELVTLYVHKNINWCYVKNLTNYKFAYIKATEGKYFWDEDLWYNVEACEKLQFPYGLYHYWRNVVDKKVQVDTFLNTIWTNPSLLPCIDLEDKAVSKTLLQDIKYWIEAVEDKLQTEVLIYTGPSWFNSKLWPLIKNSSCEQDFFLKRPLWIANYGVKVPTIPKPWTKQLLWQYSDAGGVLGVPGKCDLNIMEDSDWARLCRSNQ